LGRKEAAKREYMRRLPGVGQVGRFSSFNLREIGLDLLGQLIASFWKLRRGYLPGMSSDNAQPLSKKTTES
jgi:hypothetical protein